MAKTTIRNNSSKYKKFVTCNKCFIICSKCAENLFRLRLQQHRFPPDGPLAEFHAERKQTFPKLVVRIYTDMICLLDKLDAVLSKAQLSTSNEESLQSANKKMKDKQTTIVFI